MTREEEMLLMYEEEGLSMPQIAERFGLTRQRVHQIIGQAITETHYGKARKQERDERYKAAAERVHAGETTSRDEAARLGVTVQSFRSALSSRGFALKREPAPLHGTYYRYQRSKCRCELCRQAMRDYIAKLRARGPRVHGTASAYFNFACRCVDCRRAGSIANREARIRRKMREKERMPDE